ncbi:hypothetical protein CW357_07805 [Rummeliibacillus sp. TYF005]|nr:hypothetical protein CW357_07805 [Rummeliibacillus sp. TYF005]
MEVMNVNNNRVLSSLCYFSVFFAGLILPLIVFFVANEPEVKRHAKRAFLSHLLLIIPTIIGVIIFIVVVMSFGFQSSSYESIGLNSNGLSYSSSGDTFIIIAWLIFIVFEVILSLAVFIWNIVQGIKVLKA